MSDLSKVSLWLQKICERDLRLKCRAAKLVPMDQSGTTFSYERVAHTRSHSVTAPLPQKSWDKNISNDLE